MWLYLVNGISSLVAPPVLNIVMGSLELAWPLEFLQSYHGRDVTAEEVSEDILIDLSLIRLTTGILTVLTLFIGIFWFYLHQTVLHLGPTHFYHVDTGG